jgi:hypothetical protein
MIRTIEQDFCFVMFLTRLSQRSATCRNGDKKASFRSAGSGLIDKDVGLQTDTHVIGHTRISRSDRHFRSRMVVVQLCDDDSRAGRSAFRLSARSPLPCASSQGVTFTVTGRVMDGDDENFMKTSKDTQARSGAMLLTWNN